MKATAAVLMFAFVAMSAQAGRYDDVTAWGIHDSDNYRQFVIDLRKARSGHDVATALKKNASGQRKATDELVRLIHAHGELRNVPELGLDGDGLQIWKQTHPTSNSRKLNVPAEVRDVQHRMHTSNARFDSDGGAQPADVLRKCRDDGSENT